MYNYIDVAPKGLLLKESKPKNIINHDNSILIVGRQGSGKTYLMTEMIKRPELLAQKYSGIYFIGPSPIPLVTDQNRATIHTALPDLAWMTEKCEYHNTIGKEKEKKQHVLFVFDDCLAQLGQMGCNKEFQQLFWNRRWHYKWVCISYIFTAQYARAFPRKFRSCVNTVIAYSMSEEDWKIVARDCLFKKDDEQDALISTHLSQPHKFIVIKCDTGEVFLDFKQKI